MNINEMILFWPQIERKTLFWPQIERKTHILFSERCKMLNEIDSCGFDSARP